jgi:hypothetical protein
LESQENTIQKIEQGFLLSLFYLIIKNPHFKVRKILDKKFCKVHGNKGLMVSSQSILLSLLLNTSSFSGKDSVIHRESREKNTVKMW